MVLVYHTIKVKCLLQKKLKIILVTDTKYVNISASIPLL